MPKPPEAPERQYVELRVAPRVKDTIGSVFLEGHHRPAVNAMRELADNVVDARHRQEGEPPTVVFVTRTDDRLSVFGGFEAGMGPEQIAALVSLGTTGGKGIGVRGIGAEAAAFYLARDLKIVCKREGDTHEWEMDVKGYGDITEEYGGKRAIDPRPVKDQSVGRIETMLTGLKLGREELPGGAELRAALAETYRPLLPPPNTPLTPLRTHAQELPARMTVNEEGNIVPVHDRVAMFVSYKKNTEPVRPSEIPLKEGYGSDLNVAWTEVPGGRAEPLGYWVGEVDRSQTGGQKVEAGFTVYFDGRMVRKREWWGHDSRHAALRDLVGEAHVDHVRGIKEKLMVNKSQGVSTSSPEWQRVVAAMNRKIAPFIEELKSRPFEADPRLPAGLDAVLAAARLCADSALHEMLKSDDVLAELLGQATLGTAQGQRHPTTEGKRGGKKGKPLGIEGVAWTDQNPQTFPTPDVDPAIARKRRGFLNGPIEARDLGAGVPATSILESLKDREGRRLVINTGHPAFQVLLEILRRDGVMGKFLIGKHAAEEIVDHAAELLGGKNAELVERYRDEGRYKAGKLLQQDPHLAMIKMRPDESEKKVGKKKR